MNSSNLISTAGLRRSKTAEETHLLGYQLGKKLSSGAIVALKGELGAGKTTFVGGIVEAVIGKRFAVESPTFTYLNIYEDQVFHFDLYRLSSAAQFLEMGFEEFLFAEGISCIEWSERIEGLLPKETIIVELMHDTEGRCIISKLFAS